MSDESEKPESRKPKTEIGRPVCAVPGVSPSAPNGGEAASREQAGNQGSASRFPRSRLAAPITEGGEEDKTSAIALQRIESVLRKEIGLDAASIGTTAIERTVRLRMKKLGLQDTAEYARQLGSCQAELDELIEAVVVMETWFFRDQEPFRAFLRLALEKLEKAQSKNQKTETGFALSPAPSLAPSEGQKTSALPPLRVLSVPCSSGEEPYSLAITLLDAHIPTHRFVIHAADVSTHALERAKQAVYGRNSFRGKELAFRDHHFRATKDGYALNVPVRECVQFYRDNLLGGDFLAGHAPYDFILCRNLLIYFDRATQIQALEKLHQLLTPEGVLFVGPAEVPLVTHKGFVNANIPMAFACRKTAIKVEGQSEKAAAEATGSPPLLARGRTPPERVTDSSSARRLAAPSPPGTKPVSTADRGPFAPFTRSSAVRSLPDAPSDLAAARQLADAGRFEEAVMVCQAHLCDCGPSAQAYYILGLVRDATGDPQAIEHYRKALYLEPNHYETLLQMSLLLERTGDAAGARLFKRRAQRVGRRTD